ncbi:hypothetical protein [Peterkaempfera bronchialis]|uniref:Uncharacterized protein n=1 Tax=Peterkaempfera bronchialis TaxID=2126346 RepID=A0A345SV24_9ACTN|nr:hypothetical protein [Peterkaempfera bronchialis]AXI77579.1 hypothetical protein C7M71_009120 [Peterkaempfera bronchialis]
MRLGETETAVLPRAVAGDDGELLPRARAGENRAVAQLCAAEARSALATARCYRRTRREAQDLVFEAFRAAVAALQNDPGDQHAQYGGHGGSFSAQVRCQVRLRATAWLSGTGERGPLGREASLARSALAALPLPQADPLWAVEVERCPPDRYARSRQLTHQEARRALRTAQDALVDEYLRRGTRSGGPAEVRLDHLSYQTAAACVRHELAPAPLEDARRHLAGCALCRLLAAEIVLPGSSLQSTVAQAVVRRRDGGRGRAAWRGGAGHLAR